MSKQFLSPSMECSTNLVDILPKITLKDLKKHSSLFDAGSTECPSPLILDDKRSILEISRPIKKSAFAITPFEIEAYNGEENAILNLDDMKIGGQTPLKLADLLSPLDLGCTSFGEESPSPCLIMKDISNVRKSLDFSESFYARVEDYLDSENLHINQPEVNKRKNFSNLRVATLKSKHKSESLQDEMNSPSFLSPSIHTSSLFARRSSSKESSNIESAKLRPRMMPFKSPFYSCTKDDRVVVELDSDKRSELSQHDELDEEIFSPNKKRKLSDSASSTKLRGLVWNTEDNSEPSTPGLDGLKLIEC